MPSNGLIVSWSELEYHCAGDVSNSGSGAGVSTYSYQVSASTAFAPNAIDTAIGIALFCTSSFDGSSGSWLVSYDGPGAPMGGYIVTGSGYQATSISAVVKDLKIYSKLTGALFRVTWSAIDIYVNGAYDVTLPGSGVDLTSAGVGPNYLPIIGVPLDLAGSCSAGRTGIEPFEYDPCEPDEFEPQSYVTHSTGAATGGWRFKEAGEGTWQTLPVTPYYLESPSTGGTCPFGLDVEGVVDGDNSFGITIELEDYKEREFTYEGRDACQWFSVVCCIETGPEPPDEPDCETFEISGQCVSPCDESLIDPYQDVYKDRNHARTSGGRIRIVPDLDKAIQRHAEGYRALLLRLPLPAVTAMASRFCTIDSVTTSASSTPVVYPGSAEFLGAVGDSTHAMEDLLALPTYAPTNASKTESESIEYSFFGVGLCICSDPTGNCMGCPAGCGFGCYDLCPEYDDSYQEESVGFNLLADVGDEGSYQWHFADEYRYLGTWGNLLWHYLHYHEPWSGISYADYWGVIRQQWINNAAAEIAINTRSDMIGSCHEESGHTPFLDEFVGGYRWLGCSRWRIRKPDIPAELATDSTGTARWKFGIEVDAEFNGEGTVGSTITLEPGTTRATVDVLDFESAPYLYALICDRIRIESGTNIDSIKVTAIGIDGARATVCTETGTFDLPNGRSRRYAGSWGIDNGNGVLTDEGTDSIYKKGISAETMSDVKRCVGFELLPTYACARLRFDIVPANPAEEITFPHPVFIASEETPTMVWESAQICALLYPDGQLVRLGNWLWYDGTSLNNPPSVVGAGYKSTVIDALCTLRMIWEGRAHDDGLTTELTALYDSYEGQSVGVVDKFSIAYPLATDNGMPWALVNTISECPPLTCFPNRSWNSSTWEQDGSYKHQVWDWTQEPRYLLTAGDEAAHLTTAGDIQWTSAFLGVPSGWSASVHTHAVTNSELPDFKVVKGEKTWAEVTPWRGYSAVLDYLPDGSRVSYNVARHMRHYAAYVNDDGFVVIGRSDNADHTSFDEITTEIEAESLCIYAERATVNQLLTLYYTDADGLHARTSGDDGETWSMPTTISGDGFSPAVVLSNNGTRYLYWLQEETDTWTIKGQLQDALGQVVEDTFTIASDADGEGLACDESVGADGLHRITLLYRAYSELTALVSYNGIDFS